MATFTVNYIITHSEGCGERLAALRESLPADFLQLNVFDSVCDDVSREAGQAAANAVGNGSCYQPCQQMAEGTIRNMALSLSEGAYVNFCDSDVFLTGRILLELDALIKKNKPFRIFCLSPFRRNDRGREISYFESAKQAYKESDNFVNLCLQSYFFERTLARRLAFDESLVFESDFAWIIRQISMEKAYFVTPVRVETALVFETDFYNYPFQYYPEWYGQTLREVYLPLLKECGKSRFAQLAVCYLVELRFACNRNNRNKNVLEGEAVDGFIEDCSRVFAAIDDKILLKYNLAGRKLFPKYMNLVMLKIKYRKPGLLPDIITSPSEFFASFKGRIFERFSNLALEIKAVNREKKQLVFDCEIANAYVFGKNRGNGPDCYAKANGKKFPFVSHAVYSLDKYFGRTMKSGHTGSISIPVGQLPAGSDIGFYMRFRDCAFRLPLRFVKTASRLADGVPLCWKFGGLAMRYAPLSSAINVVKASGWQRLKNEVRVCSFLLKKAFGGGAPLGRTLRAMVLRLAYWLTKPFMRREVWITFDQLFKGGDNAEYLFRYVSEHPVTGVDMYYVINRDCADSIRLKQRYGNVVDYNSFRCRLLALHAAYVFATRVDVKQYLGFTNESELYFRDLLNYKVLCLQHGLSIQQIAEYQNRLFDNTLYYFCVSKHEISNLLHPVYGYSGENLLLTGAPRYDGLVSDDKRQVLIAPTWRRNVTAGTNRKGETTLHNENFKDSEYYRIYNGLINDGRLIECARRCGYRIIYLVHPNLSSQVDDFERNDFVEILAGASGNVSYERMLCESSLMVTDHSGIQYDFAFMKKPVIYYHPDALPPQYEAKSMDYETMGFGPICRGHEELVSAICACMERNCQIEPEYERRIDGFFAFTDRNNCRRVVESMAYIRAREARGKSAVPAPLLWRLAGYGVSTGDKAADEELAGISCRLCVAEPPLAVRKFSPEGVHLTWRAVAGVKKWLLQRSQGDGEWVNLAELPAESSGYVDAPERFPVMYRLTAQADKTRGTAECRVEEWTRVDKPEGLRLESCEEGLRLVWDPVPNASGYNVRCIPAKGAKPRKVATLDCGQTGFVLPEKLRKSTGWQVEAFREGRQATAYSGYCAAVSGDTAIQAESSAAETAVDEKDI